MNRESYDPLNPHRLDWREGDKFYVRISKPGPRGGKRPPLWEGYVRTWTGDYSDAVEQAEKDLLSTTKTEVSAG